MIDTSNYERIHFKYDKIHQNYMKDYTVAVVQVNNLWFIIDNKGKEINSTTFDDVKYFGSNNDSFAVKINNKWGYITLLY